MSILDRSPTLDDVARQAGVSRATASRAINGGDRVSPDALAAVEAAVRELGYVPNRAAQSLVRGRTGSIALVIPEPDERIFSDPFFPAVVRGVTRVLGERDLQLVLLMARPGDEGLLARYLGGRHVDGALVVSHHRALVEEARGLPSVFVGRPWSDADRFSYVDTDNLAGSRMATEALVERGRRRIATIAGPADMSAAQDRLQGWHQAMHAAGLPDDAVAHGDFTEQGGAVAAAALLDAHPDLDGVVAASDLMAAGALKVLASRGRRVPDDVSVIGYDDLGVPERTDPPLTTIVQPVTEMAEHATRLLVDQVLGTHPGRPVRVIFPPVLVRRGSV